MEDHLPTASNAGNDSRRRPGAADAGGTGSEPLF